MTAATTYGDSSDALGGRQAQEEEMAVYFFKKPSNLTSAERERTLYIAPLHLGHHSI